MESQVPQPLNIGSDQLVSVNQLVDIVESLAGVKLVRRYKLDAPKGVRGRNSDNTLVRRRLAWSPSKRLEDGLRETYAWIYSKLAVANIGRHMQYELLSVVVPVHGSRAKKRIFPCKRVRRSRPP